MTVIEATMLGAVISSITALITYGFSTRRSVSKDELADALKLHQKMCRESLQAMREADHDIDKVRNGRLSRLEEVTATKEDIRRLEKSIEELKEITMAIVTKIMEPPTK